MAHMGIMVMVTMAIPSIMVIITMGIPDIMGIAVMVVIIITQINITEVIVIAILPLGIINNTPRSYLVTIPENTKVYSDSNVYQQSNAEYSGINSSAWQTLGLGQYSAALNVFAEESQSHPNSGVPKAGYSLATAANGDLERGVWAMRRAFRIDPDSLHYLQLDEKNYLLVDNLIGQYSSQKIEGSDGKDFMISALHYLKHDYSAAKQSIINAQQYGDKSSSITNLQRLIDQQLSTDEEN